VQHIVADTNVKQAAHEKILTHQVISFSEINKARKKVLLLQMRSTTKPYAR
jgi:hypothetical protein